MGSPYPKPACRGTGRECDEEAGAAVMDTLNGVQGGFPELGGVGGEDTRREGSESRQELWGKGGQSGGGRPAEEAQWGWGALVGQGEGIRAGGRVTGSSESQAPRPSSAYSTGNRQGGVNEQLLVTLGREGRGRAKERSETDPHRQVGRVGQRLGGAGRPSWGEVTDITQPHENGETTGDKEARDREE